MCYEVANVTTLATISPSAKPSRVELSLGLRQAQAAGLEAMAPRIVPARSRNTICRRTGRRHRAQEIDCYRQRWTLACLTPKRGDGRQGVPDSLRAPSNERGLLMTDRTEFTTITIRPDWKFPIGMS